MLAINKIRCYNIKIETINYSQRQGEYCMEKVKYEKIIDLTEDMIYQDLLEPIGELYAKYRKKMQLPDLTEPKKQLEYLEENKIVTGIIGRIKELKFQNEGVKFRLYPYKMGIDSIAMGINIILES